MSLSHWAFHTAIIRSLMFYSQLYVVTFQLLRPASSRQKNVSFYGNWTTTSEGLNVFLRSLFDSQVSTRLQMRSEGKGSGRRGTFSHLSPTAHTTAWLHIVFPPHPPLNLDVNMVSGQTCVREFYVTRTYSNGHLKGIWHKFEPAENNHHVSNEVQEVQPQH